MVEKKTFCRVCEPSCALIAQVEDNEIVSLKPDKTHPVTKGFACHKGLATLEIHNDPDRLSFPQKRANQQLERISWDEAAEEVASRLNEIKEKYGEGAIASYGGNPLAFNSLAIPAIGSFLMKNQIKKNFFAGTQDCSNKFAGSEAMFGSSTIHPLPDIDNTDYLLMLGCNPRVSHMSFMSIADPMKSLRDAKKRGASIRFVDPRRNESVAGIGDIIHVNPDSDVYLLAAMLNHLDATDQFDEQCLQAQGENVEGLRLFVRQYPPERVADVVGISVDEITALANDFSCADSAAVYMSTGVNMGRQGTLAYWLMFMLSVVTGNFDRPGGNYYSLGFYPAAKAGRIRSDPPYFDSPFGDVREIRGHLPGNLMADMILDEDDPIKAMVVISGNPLISVGGSSRLKQAFESLEFLLVIDIYPTVTAEMADIVLPATGMYERPDINICGLGMQHKPFVQFTDAVVPEKYERKPEWWILGRIEKAQGYDSILDDEDSVFGRYDQMLRYSGTSVKELSVLSNQTDVLPENKPGSFFEQWIQTQSGRINCCPVIFSEGMQRCEDIFISMKGAKDNQLKMITRRTNYMVNSWFHNLKSLKRKQHLDNPLYMNPKDAEVRSLGDGSDVRVFNENGSITARVSIDEGLKTGTVAMTHGWGHGASRMQVARHYAGVNANELLPSGPGSYEKLSNQAFMTGIPVDVQAV